MEKAGFDILADHADRPPEPSAWALAQDAEAFINRARRCPALYADWKRRLDFELPEQHPTWSNRDFLLFLMDEFRERLELEEVGKTEVKQPESYAEAFAGIDAAHVATSTEWVMENRAHYKDLLERGRNADARQFAMTAPSGAAISLLEWSLEDFKGFCQFAAKVIGKNDTELTERQKADDKRRMFRVLAAFDE